MINASQRRILKCLAASAVIAVLAGCGNNTSSVTAPTLLGTADFSGPFVFSISGTDPNDGDYSVAGTFTADGKGNITSGIADYNLGSGIDSSVPLAGTYTTVNGSAIIKLTDGGSVSDAYYVTIVKTGSTTLFRTDGTGSGTLYAAATPTSAPAGTYSVSLKGEGDSGTDTVTASFVTASTGAFSGGTESYTEGVNLSNYSSISGFLYPAAPNGRGQAAIGGNTLSYYLVSSSQAVLIGLDSRVLLSGTATKM